MPEIEETLSKEKKKPYPSLKKIARKKDAWAKSREKENKKKN